MSGRRSVPRRPMLATALAGGELPPIARTAEPGPAHPRRLEQTSAAQATTYLVECFTPGVSRAQVEAAAVRAREASADLHASGTAIEYLSTLFMPADEVVFHVFRARHVDAVHQAGNRAELGFERVIESIVIYSRPDGG